MLIIDRVKEDDVPEFTKELILLEEKEISNLKIRSLYMRTHCLRIEASYTAENTEKFVKFEFDGPFCIKDGFLYTKWSKAYYKFFNECEDDSTINI